MTLIPIFCYTCGHPFQACICGPQPKPKENQPFELEFNEPNDGDFEMRDAKVISRDRVLAALESAYHNADRQVLVSRDLKCGHRAGVRDVAVRLGLYPQFSQMVDKDEPDGT